MDETTIPEIVWVEYITDANKQYFYNKETKETTWKVPPDYTAWKDKAVKEYLKTTNWRKAVDKKDKTYYYDKVTKQTQWDIPSDVVDFETWLVKLNQHRYDSRKRKAKEISAAVKVDVAPVVSVIAAEVKEDVAPVVSTTTHSQEDIRPSSKIKKRAIQSDDYDDDDANDFHSGSADLSTATSTQKSSRGRLDDASSSNYSSRINSDRDEYQSNEQQGKEQQKQTESRNDIKSKLTSLSDSIDQSNDYEDDYFNQHERGMTPEQVTPQYDQSTTQYDEGTPPYEETTPELGTNEFQESTPQYRSESPVAELREVGTPVFQETTPDYADQQDRTPYGSEGEGEGEGDGDNYGGYGDYDRQDTAHASESHTEWSEDVQDNAIVDKESQSEAQLQEELDMMKSLDERLGERDSIMELDVAETIRKSIELREGKNPGAIIRLMADSYSGYAQMAHIASEWLSLAAMLDSPITGNSSTLNTRASQTGVSSDPEVVVVEHLASIIKLKFDSTVADAIIPSLRDTPEWLKKMMSDSTLRMTLIELHDQNRNSTLIKTALKEICKMGHHREIAHVIRDLDYFDVFSDSDLLVDIIVRTNQAGEEELKDLLEVLTRMCCNTEYMFLYTMEIFKLVDEKLGVEIELDFYRRITGCNGVDNEGVTEGGTGSVTCPNGENGLFGSEVKHYSIDDDRNRNSSSGKNGDENSDGNTNYSNNNSSSNGNTNGTSSHPPHTPHTKSLKSIPPGPGLILPAVRQRRRLRRFRQELESAGVWVKRDRSGALTNQGAFASKLLTSCVVKRTGGRTGRGAIASSGSGSSNGGGVNNTNGTSSSSSIGEDRGVWSGKGAETQSAIRAIVSDILKYAQVTGVHVQRLSACFYGPDASGQPKDTPSPPTSVSPVLLRDPLVLDLLIASLVHPARQLPPPTHILISKLLAYACASLYEENPELGAKEDSTSEGDRNDKAANEADLLLIVGNALMTAREICSELSKTAIGVNSYDRPSQLIALLKHPVVSMCVIKWIGYLLVDSDFTRKSVFLSVLPAFLQLIVEAGARHPFQRPDCFELYKLILMLSPSDREDSDSSKRFQASAEAYTIVTGQKDSMTCLMHLMGSGFVSQPMAFLATHLAGLDAVLVRHLVRTLLQSVLPPFSPEFALNMVDLLTSSSARKAINSTYFPKGDALLLKQFYENILESKLFNQGDRNTSGINEMAPNKMNSSTLALFSDVVSTCCTMHKI